jgi:hypothetical protein
MFALLVEDNHLRDIVLKPGDPRYGDYPPLPYEEENDRWAPRPPRPRSRAVLDLARRQTSDKGD